MTGLRVRQGRLGEALFTTDNVRFQKERPPQKKRQPLVPDKNEGSGSMRGGHSFAP
jgi:hypothetical protein